MRTAYIGNLGEGSALHSTENEVAKALTALGVEVLPFHEQRFRWNAAEIPDVDFAIWTHTHGFAPPRTHGRQQRFLDTMRSRGIPIVSYHLDRYWDLYRESMVYGPGKEPFFCTDLMCSADGGNDDRWAKAGVEHVWFPPAVSEFECEPGTPRDEYRSDIAFVGSWQGGYHAESTHRAQLVDWLRDTYGDRCAFWPKPGHHAVRGQDLRDLYASVKVLVGDSCFSGDPRGKKYWSDRIPECVGRGGLLVHPEVEGLEEHFKAGEHLLTWPAGDWSALNNTIDAALGDDDMRRDVSAAGRRHVLETATYTVRMRRLLAILRTKLRQGGIVQPGDIYLVGESGPEAAVPA